MSRGGISEEEGDSGQYSDAETSRGKHDGGWCRLGTKASEDGADEMGRLAEVDLKAQEERYGCACEEG